MVKVVTDPKMEKKKTCVSLIILRMSWQVTSELQGGLKSETGKVYYKLAKEASGMCLISDSETSGHKGHSCLSQSCSFKMYFSDENSDHKRRHFLGCGQSLFT